MTSYYISFGCFLQLISRRTNILVWNFLEKFCFIGNFRLKILEKLKQNYAMVLISKIRDCCRSFSNRLERIKTQFSKAFAESSYNKPVKVNNWDYESIVNQVIGLMHSDQCFSIDFTVLSLFLSNFYAELLISTDKRIYRNLAPFFRVIIRFQYYIRDSIKCDLFFDSALSKVSWQQLTESKIEMEICRRSLSQNIFHSVKIIWLRKLNTKGIYNCKKKWARAPYTYATGFQP